MSTTDIDKNRLPTKLLWVDLEMTGLDVQNDVILEVAALVTDMQLNVLASYEAVIWQSDEVIDRSNPWAKQQHTVSGLLQRVRADGRPESDITHELAGFINLHFDDEPAVLSGNSIHNDRNFIKRWWPEIDDLLHYRMLDVSSYKIMMQARGLEFKKAESHRALGDIQESIAELTYYLGAGSGPQDS